MIAAAKIAIQVLRRFGPYAAIELLLPGGSLLALLLWLYRRHRAGVRPIGGVGALGYEGGTSRQCARASRNARSLGGLLKT
jgi:hypothetical protein